MKGYVIESVVLGSVALAYVVAAAYIVFRLEPARRHVSPFFLLCPLLPPSPLLLLLLFIHAEPLCSALLCCAGPRLRGTSCL
jgi:hypothetical protein